MPSWRPAIQQVRYRCYTLQRSVEITRANLLRLQHARLYVLIDGGPDEKSLAALGPRTDRCRGPRSSNSATSGSTSGGRSTG